MHAVVRIVVRIILRIIIRIILRIVVRIISDSIMQHRIHRIAAHIIRIVEQLARI